MAMAIPVIVSWVAASEIAAGTIAAYMAYAGATLSTIGALTNKKDLLLAGSVLSLGAGFSASFGAEAAGSTVLDAAANSGTYGNSIDAMMNNSASSTLAPAAQGSSEALQAAQAAPNASGPMFNTSAGNDYGALNQAGQDVAQSVQPPPEISAGNQAVSQAQPGAPTDPMGGQSVAAQPGFDGSYKSPFDNITTPNAYVNQAMENAVAGVASPSQMLSNTGATGANFASNGLGDLGGTGGAGGGGILDQAGKFIKNNKELFDIGGKMIGGMFGPESEKLDIYKQNRDRQLRNMNTVVKLGAR